MPANRSPWRRRLLIVLALALLALLVHTLFGPRGYLALRQQQREYERLKLEIQALQDENRRLSEEIKALKSDPQMIERLAREELRLARPGETVIALPQTQPLQPPAEQKKKN